MKRLRVLLLCHRPLAQNAQTIVDHVDAFGRHSRHEVLTVTLASNLGNLPGRLDLEEFDVLVVHYSIAAALDTYLNSSAKDRIARFDGLKVQFIQDEYRFVNATIETTCRLGIDVLFTCVPEGEVEKVYGELPGVRKITNLTGYVPEGLANLVAPRLAERPVDVGYRARKLPYWLGTLGVEKWRIAEDFLEATRNSGLACDISSDENSRLYGKKWIRFLTRCKAVLGVESGASVFDFTGEIKKRVEEFVAEKPDASFEEVRARFFSEEEGRIRLNQISPRCFEAAALRTAMVLFEGEYSGILIPRRHYVPLQKDLGNIGEVVDLLRDTTRLQEITDCAYREIACNTDYSYARFVERFDEIVQAEYASRCGGHRGHPARRGGWWHRRIGLPLYLKSFYADQVIVYYIQLTIFRAWMLLPRSARERLRPLSRGLRDRLSTRLRVRS